MQRAAAVSTVTRTHYCGEATPRTARGDLMKKKKKKMYR